ncbi:hypothetical protein BSKO_07038 [Bryopsis sp. KO-2023]|nr:hypothetical protein BSKO_07038 [Bryopsis sp. KO-2023]
MLSAACRGLQILTSAVGSPLRSLALDVCARSSSMHKCSKRISPLLQMTAGMEPQYQVVVVSQKHANKHACHAFIHLDREDLIFLEVHTYGRLHDAHIAIWFKSEKGRLCTFGDWKRSNRRVHHGVDCKSGNFGDAGSVGCALKLDGRQAEGNVRVCCGVPPKVSWLCAVEIDLSHGMDFVMPGPYAESTRGRINCNSKKVIEWTM